MFHVIMSFVGREECVIKNIFFLILLASCSRLELMTHDCDMAVPYGKYDPEKKTSFSFEKTIYTPFSPLVSEDIEVKDLLEEEHINCLDVTRLEWTYKTSSSDAFWGLIPFLSRKTVIFTGEKK